MDRKIEFFLFANMYLPFFQRKSPKRKFEFEIKFFLFQPQSEKIFFLSFSLYLALKQSRIRSTCRRLKKLFYVLILRQQVLQQVKKQC